jgi:hypothetical protein
MGNDIYEFPDDTLRSRVRRLESNAAYLRSGSLVRNRGSYRPVNTAALDASGNIDPTDSSIIKMGSMPSYTNTAGFAATSTSGGGAGTSSLTIFWDGTNSSSLVVVNRSDQSQFVVPGSSITISGLDPSTTYYFLPFWSRYGCSVGWVLGTVGSPQIAFTTNTDTSAFAKQLYQDREGLTSGFMSFATAAAAASTGGTGGGGGGSAGRCVMTGTDIDPLGNSPYSVGIHQEENWQRLTTDNHLSVNCTLNHPVYVNRDMVITSLIAQYGFDGLINAQNADSLLQDARCEAATVQVGESILTRFGLRPVTESYAFLRACTKRSVHMDYGHLYWANGILSHNYKIETL